jgi:hypothetical protein
MTATLKTTGRGVKGTIEDFKKAFKPGSHVVVGVLGTGPSRGDGELTNAQLAVIHEFGTGHIPERSFLRRTFDMKKQEWFKVLVKLMKSKTAKSGDVLALMGERMKSDIKRQITTGAGIPPPNAPATIAAKGSSRPLVDTGRLVGSIDYNVRGL